jgi:hypothetical protein
MSSPLRSTPTPTTLKAGSRMACTMRWRMHQPVVRRSDVQAIKGDVFALAVRRQIFIAESNLRWRLALKLVGKLPMLHHQFRVFARGLGQALIDGQWLEPLLTALLVEQLNKLRLPSRVELFCLGIGCGTACGSNGDATASGRWSARRCDRNSMQAMSSHEAARWREPADLSGCIVSSRTIPRRFEQSRQYSIVRWNRILSRRGLPRLTRFPSLLRPGKDAPAVAQPCRLCG